MKTLKALSQVDLAFVKETAKRELMELDAALRLDGMKKALSFDERVTLCYLIAAVNLLVKHGVVPAARVPAIPLLADDSLPQEDDYGV